MKASITGIWRFLLPAQALLVAALAHADTAPATATPTPAPSVLPAPAKATDLTTEEIAKKFTPSVVVIVGASEEGAALGTAYIVSSDGMIITNYHVIQGSSKFAVKTSNGGQYRVTAVLATDPKHDIAILKIDARDLPVLQLADSSTVTAGQKIIVIGNPKGLESSVTEGIVSAIRDDEIHGGKCIQISAAISHGSSGSPVFNSEGQVIGMATFNLEGGQALNFAIPSNVINDLLTKAKTAKAPEIDLTGTSSFAIGGSTREADPDNPSSAYLPLEIYKPNAAYKGSKTQDAAVLADPLYATYRDAATTGDYFGLLAPGQALAKKYPDSALAWRKLAVAFGDASRIQESANATRYAIDLDPDSVRGWAYLAALYYDECNDRAFALKLCTKVMDNSPDDAQILIIYCKLLRETDRGASMQVLDHVKKLLLDGKGSDPETIGDPYYAKVVDLYDKEGKYTEAYDTGLAFLHKTTSNGNLYLAFGYASLNLKQYDSLQGIADKAVSLNPRLKQQSMKFLGTAAFNKGDTISAMRDYQQAYAMDSSDPATSTDLIYIICHKAVITNGDLDNLSEYMQRLRRLDPKKAKTVETDATEFLKQRNIPAPW